MNNSSLRSDPQRPKRPSATARTTTLRRWGPRQCEATCVLRNLLFPQLCGTVTKTVSEGPAVEEQLSNKTIRPAMRALLHLPDLDLYWALKLL